MSEALDKAKQSDLSSVIYLMELNERNTDKVLDSFVRYIHAPNDDVRFGVLQAASAVKSVKALSVLTSMLNDSSLGMDAAKAIYQTYNKQELRKLGNKNLKASLLRASIQSRYSIESVLLLPLYKGDAATLRFLEARRKSYRPRKGSDDFAYSSQLVSIDLALAEFGKSDALERIKTLFSQKKVDDILFLISRLKFFENEEVLSQALALLKDKSNARNIGFADGPPKYTRLCDEAFIALSQKFDPAFKEPYLPPRYSDAELTNAFNRFRQQIAGKVLIKKYSA